jgi:micrococcal nuclease
MHFQESKLLIIAALFILLGAGSVFGQTNFEFFFKTDQEYKDVFIQEVLSNDRILIEKGVGEKGEVIKLIGLRAPAAPKKKAEDIKRNKLNIVIQEPVSPLASMDDKAFGFARELLEGKRVRLEFDTIKMNDNNETLAYVFLLEDNMFANREILRQGYADLSIRPPNTKYEDVLREAYKEASREKRGLRGQ